MRRTSIVAASALTFACLTLLASEPAAAAEAPRGVLLGSSQSIAAQMDAVTQRRVMRTLAGLRLGPGATVASPRALDNLLDYNLTEAAATSNDELDEAEIEIHAPPGVQEQPLQSRIPLGLAALAWGVEHPSDCWRLLLPVLS